MKTIIIIGGGPGGYVAAIRAAQLGGNVTLVEKDCLGGTCLNIGCIPTKALLHAAEFIEVVKQAASHGITLHLEGFDWNQIQLKKAQTVSGLTNGVKGLLKANGVTIIHGVAKLLSANTVSVIDCDGESKLLTAEKIIIASGSVPEIPPIPGLIENPNCITSTEALSLDAVPNRMVIIGGGVIGMELGYFFSTFGAKVTTIEALPRILPSMDEELAIQLQKMMKAQGIDIITGASVEAIENNNGEISVEAVQGNKLFSIPADTVLVATGRRPNTGHLGLKEIGIVMDGAGIKVDKRLETNISGIYAIGDCLGKTMLAHVASAQGEIAAENALGGEAFFEGETIPSCVYSNPEFAGVGLTEGQAKELKMNYIVSKFPLAANGKALIMNEGKGLVKLITDSKSGIILGAHILGPRATDLIGECTFAINIGATAKALVETIHAHPTVSEAIREAALVAEKRPLHTL